MIIFLAIGICLISGIIILGVLALNDKLVDELFEGDKNK